MSRPIVPASPAPPAPPALAKLRQLAASRDSAASQSSALPLPNGTSRPQLQRQQPQSTWSMDHTQTRQSGPPLLSPGKSRTQSMEKKGPPSLPPGKPRAHSLESKHQAPPPPLPQRTKPGIQRQDQDRRDSCAPPPLPPPRTNDQRPVVASQQPQCHRGPPPLPPRDRAVSMEEKSSCQPTQIRGRKLSEPTRGEPHVAPPPLPNRPLPVIPAEPSHAATGSRPATCDSVICMSEQSLKSQEIFEEQFIFPPVTNFPAPEPFVKFARVYPSLLWERERRGIPP